LAAMVQCDLEACLRTELHTADFEDSTLEAEIAFDLAVWATA